MKKILALAVAAGVVIVAVRCVAIRKNLRAERRSIDANWAQVNEALAHRAGLVPEFARTVGPELEGQAGASAIEAVHNASKALDAAKDQQAKILANARLDEAIARLMLLVENYPKLEGSKKYGDLLEALKGAEYRIAVARRKYNEAVEHYNARIEVFPDNIVATAAGMHKVDAYFQTPAI